MWRHGYTTRDRQRWRCFLCAVTEIRRRPDTHLRHARRQAWQWLTGKASVSEIAQLSGLTRQSLSKQFQNIFSDQASFTRPRSISVLILDGIYIHGRTLLALIGLTDNRHLVWSFTNRETSGSWFELLSRLPIPTVVVCDGHSGLMPTLRALWPQTAIQRCHFHVLKLARVYLTLSPRTRAGRELQALLWTLTSCRTHQARDDFRLRFETWCRRYETLLSERSHSIDEHKRKHWWYTHKKLRGIRSLLVHALPNLFTFLDYPDCPNTTNAVEGGVNAQIAEALRLHRGLRLHQKQTLVSFVLAKINQQKTTRKVT